jgi:ATP-dependent DNA ligase
VPSRGSGLGSSGWRFPAIAAAVVNLVARSFTIDGEAVVVGPDGLSYFDQLRRRDVPGPRSSMPLT